MWFEKNKICRVIKCDTELNKKVKIILLINKNRLQNCGTGPVPLVKGLKIV
jgi:hypothetical protein